MRYMTKPNQAACSTILHMFYMQAIRSVIEYTASCIFTASNTSIDVLEKIQNKALRLILGAPAWTMLCNMQLEANHPSLHNRIQTTNFSHIQKFIRRENSQLHLKISQAQHQDPTVFTKKTWVNHIANGIKELGAQQLFNNFEMDPPNDTYRVPPPWQEKELTTTIHRLSHSKDKLKSEGSARTRDQSTTDKESRSITQTTQSTTEEQQRHLCVTT
ncbi:hypothetical protein E2C01_060320 [Portunus trituberculatus]|uniref:Uncharacterized protein n=1 Tax=Portunus trituberculatus TaxID=210409 RepID=A0A5B7HBQ9_PORTR|nr:hypothetical protein [Portunus trituberculatus]